MVEATTEMQDEASEYLKKLGIEHEKLGSTELDLFNVSFNRQFIQAFPQREIIDIYARHIREILMGAMIAKKQMTTAFGGMFPGSNQIGMGEVRACYLGVGDDWEDIYRIQGAQRTYWPTGSVQHWIHAGTAYLNTYPTGWGNPVRIEENQVTVIIAIGSKHPSPKLESAYITIDGKPKPLIVTHFGTRMATFGALPVKELDDAIILYEGKEFYASVFFSDHFGEAVSQVTDYPFPLGASFIKEPELRVQDPASLIGTEAARDAHKLIVPT